MRILLLILLFGLTGSAGAQKLYPVKKKDKWGYMNQDGKVVIDFKYDLAQNFNEGYASVALGNMPCLIDENENRVVDTGLYQYIGTYSEGLVSVMDYKFKRYYLNNKGKVTLTLSAEIYDARSFNKGLARVGKKIDVVQQKFGFDISNLGYKFAYIRKDGSYATGFIYDDGDDFTDEVARIITDHKFGLMDSTGKEILPPKYLFISNFNDGLAVYSENGKFGYINTKGQVVIEARFTYAKEFNEGLAAVESEGKLGFINTSGEMVIAAQYDDVRPFSEGRAGVFYQGKWAIIDAKGNYIYQPYFEEIGYYSEGIVNVKLKGKWGGMDKTGRVVVPFEFENVGIFEDGIAEVIFKGINLYVNNRGELLPK